ncbi:MAG TPA: aspartate/glutamate racemase family protein [Anaerohalosphaeraceae bacterium]|nr:Asp/Glu/hydantoin racemase [Phycisphaerae bacterium]HOK94655.1 aspartate/glutamate racemase family protein [Anaerohalosphaeraceae bacterium]HOL31361.1 aspartate/glutamate racemase family protein [Anaerohalosphaeraceae bacterium]HOM75183.1 aspartate/glutamate racemase family protein [Anaerohalosphaeraceae bacterium]HPC63564.1 aspartate/glutamate racemase family protein [Anaerohalosphaeraceae bacterium]
MKKKRLTLIHTSGMMVPVFNELCRELLSDVEAVHMVDESLLKDILKDGCLSKSTARRAVNLILSADQAGTDAILVTCSSLGRAAEVGRELAESLVMRVDEPMASKAIEIGKRIGVIATLPSTLNPTVELLQRQGKGNIEIIARLCRGAFEAVVSGDAARHDKIVAESILALTDQIDVIVLAQASMARVVSTLPAAKVTVPVLASPRLAIEHLARELA